MNVLDAAYHVVHDYPGGSESLGPRIGKSPTTLSHEVARVGTAKFGLETAVKATLMSGDMRILDAFAMHCGRMTLPLPELAASDDDCCMLELGNMLHKVGELVKDTTESLRDGVITDNEMGCIDQECGVLVARISNFLKVVRQKHASSKPYRQIEDGATA